MSVWQFVGIPMLFFSAALLGDLGRDHRSGARRRRELVRIFRRIQLPLIAPDVGIVAILTFVGNFNAFDLVYAVQGALAGPDFSTDLLGTFFYRTFFGFQLQLGNPTMGATVAGMMFLIILFGVVLFLFGIQRRSRRWSSVRAAREQPAPLVTPSAVGEACRAADLHVHRALPDRAHRDRTR